MGSVARAAPGASHGNSPQAAIYVAISSRLRCFSSSALPAGATKACQEHLAGFFVPWPAKKLFTIRKWSARSACGLLSHAARAWTGFQRPDAPLLAEMARCQLAASMVSHDVTEAVACPAPPSAWSASLASALPADGGAPPLRLPPARAAEGKLKKGCRAASPACAASWRIHGPMRVSQ